MKELHLADFAQADDLPSDFCAATRRLLAVAPERDYRLHLGGREWRLYPEAALETELRPSNNQAGRIKTGLWLRDKENVEILGQGARLLVCGLPGIQGGHTGETAPVQPVFAENCTGLVLRDFSIDWSVPRAAEAVVLNSARGWVEIRVPATPPWSVWGESIHFSLDGITFQAGNLLAVNADNAAVVRGTCDHLGAGWGAIWHFEKLDHERVRIKGPLPHPLPIGAIILLLQAGIGPDNRRQPAMCIDRCRDVRIEDITLNHAVGMGLIAQDSRDISLRRCIVEPSGRRHFSLTADATHFVGCRGHILIEECRFQNQFDDCVNVHGLYHRTIRALSPHRLRIRCQHPQHDWVHIFAPGDRIAFLDVESYQPHFATRLRSFTALNGEVVELEMEEAVPVPLADEAYVENLDAHPDVTLRANVFRWNRARGVLLNGKGRVRVDRNHFESAGAAIEFETSAFWGESGSFTEVEITGNVFHDCCHSPAWGRAVIQAWPNLRKMPSSPFHNGVLRIERNTFRDAGAPLLAARSVERVIFTNNTVEGSVPPGLPLQIESCPHVVSDFSPSLP